MMFGAHLFKIFSLFSVFAGIGILMSGANTMYDSGYAGSADILKNHKTRKLLSLRENGFRKNDVFMILKRQTAKIKMTARTTRRYHVFMKISLCASI